MRSALVSMPPCRYYAHNDLSKFKHAQTKANFYEYLCRHTAPNMIKYKLLNQKHEHLDNKRAMHTQMKGSFPSHESYGQNYE